MPVLVRVTSTQSTTISDEGGDDDHDAQEGHADVADVEPLEEQHAVPEGERVIVALIGPEQELHRVREEEGDPERADQRRDARRVAQRPVCEALDRDAEDGTAGHRGERDQDEEQPDRDDGVRRAAEELEHPEADERPDHEHVAVGEVEELEDPVDERVPERDQGVDASEGEPVQGELGERVHAGRESIGA